MSVRHLILIPCIPQSHQWLGLLSKLEELLPVKFCESQEYLPDIVGKLRAAGEDEEVPVSAMGVSSLTMSEGEILSQKQQLIEIPVRFADDPAVPFPFRGRSLRTKVAFQPKPLTLNPHERPLATCDLGPIWVLSDGEGAKHFRCAFRLPILPADGSLNDVLNSERFLEMLPLLHWLRAIAVGASHQGPPLMACFIFDDPNLHWPRYGFVDYRQLAAEAERENYHVSFATIPLDTWLTHDGTAALFRRHRARLSLLIHGNNHSKKELNRPYTEAERFFLLEQAIRRIQRLERRSGLTVCRVMVPPHGACSEEMLAALPICGFEAACISHGSLRAHNGSRPWTKILGFLPSELIRGCPVLPRWGVSGDLKNTILLAAFLGQAIVLRGHHQDLRHGPELLNELARFINGLGPVAWSNMTDITRSRHLDYPSAALQLTEVSGATINQATATRGRVTQDAVSLKGEPKRSSGTGGPIMPGASIWFLRRLLTEGRDRLLLTLR